MPEQSDQRQDGGAVRWGPVCGLQFTMEWLQLLRRPIEQVGLQHHAEPTERTAPRFLHGRMHRLRGRRVSRLHHRHQGTGNAQAGVGFVRPFPRRCLIQRFGCEIGAAGTRLFPRVGELQLDHTLADRQVDRIHRQHLLGEPGCLLECVACHGCVHRVQQDGGVGGESGPPPVPPRGTIPSNCPKRDIGPAKPASRSGQSDRPAGCAPDTARRGRHPAPPPHRQSRDACCASAAMWRSTTASTKRDSGALSRASTETSIRQHSMA